MIIGVLIPTRGVERIRFEENYKRLLEDQTLKPDIIEIVNDEPLSQNVDVTYRYRIGIERLRDNGADVIVCWEDDDWYKWNYIEKMINGWVDSGKPDIYGIQSTIYYNIRLRKYAILNHKGRSSMMSMIISANANINFCNDEYPYLDYYIYTTNAHLSRGFYPGKDIICVGIKHGIGNCGGGGHSFRDYYKSDDPKFEFLKKTIDGDSFEFYKNLL